MTQQQQRQYKELMSTCKRIGANSNMFNVSQLKTVLDSVMPLARDLDMSGVDKKEYSALVALWSSLNDLIKLRTQFDTKIKSAQDALLRRAQA